MSTRDQLIADWQKRLAAAEVPVSADASRAAWLARLRVRLYRFLLSLYGGGDWNAPEMVAENQQGESDSVVIDAGALPLSGKPAKDESAIRAKLESVAKARENAAMAGPLADGIDRDAWVVVASSRWLVNPHRCAEVLQRKGITPRLIGRSHEITVEVRAHQETAAVELIASQINRLLIRPLSPRATTVALEVSSATAEIALTVLSVVAGIAMFLAVGVVAIGLRSEPTAGADVQPVDYYYAKYFYGVCAGVGLLFAEILCLQLLAIKRIRRACHPKNT